MNQAMLRRVLLSALQEATELGEMVPLSAPLAGLQLVRIPERMTVSSCALDALAMLAGFGDLQEAFEEAAAEVQE